MGLPGSGKTYLAKRMQPILKAAWYNADIVREMANDWDFSPEGRIRQSLRMKNLADFEKSQGRIVICDFVCPTSETKKNFNPDITIWMNTIKKGRFGNSAGDIEVTGAFATGTTQPDGSGAESVSNIEYERREQDKKRQIRILLPTYLPAFEDEFVKLIRR